MHRTAKRFAGAASAILVLTGFSGAAHGDGPPERPPGEGVLCIWGFVTVAVAAADRCFPGQDADFQAQLHQARDRIDAYVMKNQPATAEEITNFHRSMGQTKTEELCQGDPAALYKKLKDQGVDKVRAQVDSLISRPGKPTWGACT